MDINSKSNTKSTTTKLVVTAMLVAVAVILQYIEVPAPLMPPFIKLDFSDLPELIGAFAIGPLYGVAIAFLKNLIHLPFSSSSFVGELANFILGAAFSFTAGMIYKYNKSRKGAIIGSLVGALVMAVISFPANFFLVYPVYQNFIPLDAIIGEYAKILPSCDSLWKCLLIFNVPFTFVKGLIVAIITFIVYKPLSNVIYKMNEAFNKKKRLNIDNDKKSSIIEVFTE